MKKYMVDPIKFGIYGSVTVFLLVFGICGLIYKSWLFAAIFLVGAVGFGVYALEYGTILEISKDQICKRVIPGTKGKIISFSQIHEVGAVGSNPRNVTPDKGEKTGVIYIYFSPEKLSQTQRRELVFSIPHTMCYLRHTQQRYESVQYFWDNQIVTYNTGSRIL